MNDGVTITVQMHLKPGLGDAVAERMPAVVEETAKRPGYRSVTLYRHKDDQDRMMVVECWDSEADYRAYVDWRAARGELMDEVFAMPPQIDVWPTYFQHP